MGPDADLERDHLGNGGLYFKKSPDPSGPAHVFWHADDVRRSCNDADPFFCFGVHGKLSKYGLFFLQIGLCTYLPDHLRLSGRIFLFSLAYEGAAGKQGRYSCLR